MRFSKFVLLLAPLSLSTALLSGCANPYDINACDGGRYQPPYYGTYPDHPYYDNDYYANYQKDHFGKTDHRYDHTFGPNQVYHPAEDKPN